MSAGDPVVVSAELCSVTREGDDVVIRFGAAIDSVVHPGALAARLQHRIAMPEAGAAQLQDLLAAVLREADAPAA